MLLLPAPEHTCPVRVVAGVVLVVTALTTASCAAAHSARGVINGRSIAAGGPAPSVVWPVTGDVVLTQIAGGHAHYIVKADKNGAFRAVVKPGTYEAKTFCAGPEQVTVASKQSTAIRLICPIR